MHECKLYLLKSNNTVNICSTVVLQQLVPLKPLR